MEQINYLKLKVVSLEYQNLLLRIEQTKQKAKAAYDAELRKFGLDPEVNYQLIDESFSVIPLVPQASSQVPAAVGLMDVMLDTEVVTEDKEN